MTNDLCESLTAIVDRGAAELLKMTDDTASRPRGPGKWSPKQLVGHLIDSAVNNHARFVRAQLQDDLVFPGYDQDGWVRV
jgi:DinB superfamily